MAISRNYITLQNQIADELSGNTALLAPLSGSGLASSPIKNAIASAIAKWERVPFYFNELLIQTLAISPDSSPWQTVNGQEYYSDSDWQNPALSTVAYIRSMWVLVSGNRYTVEQRTSEYIVGVSINPAVTTTYPSDFAYEAEQVRFYPIPNGAYAVGIVGTQRFSDLVNDPDVNVWTSDAFDLIRSEAKLQLARDVLYDAEAEAAATKAIYGDPMTAGDIGFLGSLKAETGRREGRGKIIPTQF